MFLASSIYIRIVFFKVIALHAVNYIAAVVDSPCFCRSGFYFLCQLWVLKFFEIPRMKRSTKTLFNETVVVALGKHLRKDRLICASGPFMSCYQNTIFTLIYSFYGSFCFGDDVLSFCLVDFSDCFLCFTRFLYLLWVWTVMCSLSIPNFKMDQSEIHWFTGKESGRYTSRIVY